MKPRISLGLLPALTASAALALSTTNLTALQAGAATPSGEPAASSPTTQPLSYGVADVLKLSRAKVAEDTILSYVKFSCPAYAGLTAAEMVYLHDQGVPDRVVAAMLEQRQKPAGPAANA